MNEFEQSMAEANREYEGAGVMENENCIEWLRGSNVATVTVVQQRLKNRIRLYAEKYPEQFQIISERNGVIVAHIPAAAIRIQQATPREMSEEQKEAARERLAAYREEKKLLEAMQREEKALTLSVIREEEAQQ